MPGRRITQDEVIAVAALQANDPLMSHGKIAEKIGRHHSTVSRLATRFEALLRGYRDLKKRDIIDDIDCVRRAYLAHAAEPETIKKASALQAVTSYAVLTDKLLLESGRPTSITLNANVDTTMPDLLSRLKRTLEQRAGHTSSSDDNPA